MKTLSQDDYIKHVEFWERLHGIPVLGRIIRWFGPRPVYKVIGPPIWIGLHSGDPSTDNQVGDRVKSRGHSYVCPNGKPAGNLEAAARKTFDIL